MDGYPVQIEEQMVHFFRSLSECDSPPLSDSGGALNHAAIAGACSASY